MKRIILTVLVSIITVLGLSGQVYVKSSGRINYEVNKNIEYFQDGVNGYPELAPVETLAAVFTPTKSGVKLRVIDFDQIRTAHERFFKGAWIEKGFIKIKKNDRVIYYAIRDKKSYYLFILETKPGRILLEDILRVDP